MALQTQWDIGSSAITLTSKAWNLIRAATMDDVQPAAFYAAEALGYHMILDEHLIGKAVDTLQGNRNYRLENIKLQFGLSSSGIAAQVRDSDAIAETLYVMMIHTGVLGKIPVSSQQLKSFVQSVQGHSADLLASQQTANSVLGPVIEDFVVDAADQDGNNRIGQFFDPPDPKEISQLISSAFNALRDASVRCVHITGGRFGIWLVSALCWLCPNRVAVVGTKGLRIIGESSSKIVINLQNNLAPWFVEYWYVADELSQLFTVEPSSRWDWGHKVHLVPSKMAYFVSRYHFHQILTEDDMRVVGTVSYGLVIAACKYLWLANDFDNPGVIGLPTERCLFSDICQHTFMSKLEDTFTSLGWSLNALDLSIATELAIDLGDLHRFVDRFGLASASGVTWLKVISDIDSIFLDDGLHMAERDKNSSATIVRLSVYIAHVLLLQAIQQRESGYSVYPELEPYLDVIARTTSWLLDPLKSGEEEPLIPASIYLQDSLYIVKSQSFISECSPASKSRRQSFILAIASRGIVAFPRALFEAPLSLVESMEIRVLAGSLVWRSSKQQYLFEDTISPGPCKVPKATYSVIDHDFQGPRLASLAIQPNDPPKFSIRLMFNGIHLNCAFASTGDEMVQLSVAMVKFALSARAHRSSYPAAKQMEFCMSTGVTELQLKRPGSHELRLVTGATIYTFPPELKAVASYSGDSMADFLRFGAPDAARLACVVQGQASIWDYSILLISPTNQILLLHRVQTSSSFPSAHVFPGGNLSAEQDGDIPSATNAQRHQDSTVYRVGAIRECFEECGILLAKQAGRNVLLEVGDEERDQARRAVHAGKMRIREWVTEKGGVLDTGDLVSRSIYHKRFTDSSCADGLIPFTRWITPPNLPKRFTTQMYIYFLPLREAPSDTSTNALPTDSEAMIAHPTSDGGIEHTTARFLPPSKWLDMARAGEVILFPPQFFLLHLLAPFFAPENGGGSLSADELAQQRQRVVEFVASGDPPWTDKCMSPTGLLWKKGDGRVALGLDKPGLELEGRGRRGDEERVVLVEFGKGGPRRVEVAWRADVFRAERMEEDGREKL
ncbi:hypothetical protein MMC17_006664 [Xylographa soralifera]|nr:hypothetical protein [Xylographa soralifera]